MTAAETKFCPGCETTKPADAYYKHGHGRLYYRCKECISVANRAQYAKHADKRRAYDHARGTGWDRSGREKYKITERDKHDGYLRRTYGLSIDEFERLLVKQGGVCAICKGDCNRSTTKRLCVDHDHKTGAVRGLLCFQCNVGLGRFKDDTSLLKAAANYMEQCK